MDQVWLRLDVNKVDGFEVRIGYRNFLRTRNVPICSGGPSLGFDLSNRPVLAIRSIQSQGFMPGPKQHTDRRQEHRSRSKGDEPNGSIWRVLLRLRKRDRMRGGFWLVALKSLTLRRRRAEPKHGMTQDNNAKTAKRIPTRSQLVALSLPWTIGIWLLYFSLERIAPPDVFWSPTKLSIALVIAAWVIFGAKPAETAHYWLKLVLRTRRRVWLAWLLGASLCAIGSGTLWYFDPARALSRQLISDAERNDPTPFHEPCLVLEKSRDTDLAAIQLVQSYGVGDCIADPVSVLREATRAAPVLLVGEPTSGKRYTLRRLNAEIARSGEASVLLTMRECARLGDQQASLSDCIEAALARVAVSAVGRGRASKAAQSFAERHSYWVLIDGIDDPGDERLVVPLIQELEHLLERQGMRVIATGRTQNLANVLFRARIDDQVRDALRPFQAYSVRGLSAAGSEAMLQQMQAQHGAIVTALRSSSSCQAAHRGITAHIMRSPGLLTQISDFRIPAGTDGCDPELQVAMREWLADARFEAFCRSELCGSDTQKHELRELIGCFRHSTRSVVGPIKRHWIAQVLLDRKACPVSHDRYHNVESVLRALMEMGIARVVGLDEFQVATEWR